jgi:two-component system alkaline phosphatase synthesis response regulator PhoP
MSRKTKILIVENELPLAFLMVHVLTRVGCDVEVANTGKKGMEFAKETQFDLIALDICVPDANGPQICMELKQRHISRATPIIIISAKPREANIHEGLQRGVVDYITKPFDVTDFIYRVILHAKIKANRPTEVVMGTAA